MPVDAQDRRGHRRWRAEGSGRQARRDVRAVAGRPPVRSRCATRCQARRDVGGYDDVCGAEPTVATEQPAKQPRRDAKGWVRYNLEGLSGQTQVGRVRFNDDDRRTETLAKPSGACGVKLHRDDPSTDIDQVSGDGPLTSADVHYELAGTNAGSLDQPMSPGLS